MAKKQTQVAQFDRKSVAPVAPEVGNKAVTALVKAAVAHNKAGVTLLSSTQSIAQTFGCEMTSEQWDRQVKPALLEALKKTDLKEGTQTNYASDFKTAGLALMLAKTDKRFTLYMGETLGAYVSRVRADLQTAKLSSGATVYAIKADGTAKKTGPKAKTAEAKKAAKKARETDAAIKTLSAATLRDAEGGYDAKRSVAVATSLMGSEEGGTRLLRILSEHRAEFDKWALATLIAADEADAKAKAKEADDAKSVKAMTDAQRADNVAKATANANAAIAARAKANKANGASVN